MRPRPSDSFRKRPQADPQASNPRHKAEGQGVAFLASSHRQVLPHCAVSLSLGDQEQASSVCKLWGLRPPPSSLCSTVSCPLQATYTRTRLNSPRRGQCLCPNTTTVVLERQSKNRSITYHRCSWPPSSTICKAQQSPRQGCSPPTAQASRGLERQSNHSQSHSDDHKAGMPVGS